MHNKILFLLYDNRSGSTLLSALLNQYNNITVTEEIDVFVRIFEYNKAINKIKNINQYINKLQKLSNYDKMGLYNKKFSLELSKLTFPIFPIDIFNTFLKIVSSKYKDNCEFLIIKSSIIYYYNQINLIYPKIGYIHIFRDGRAVFSSKKHSLSVNGKLMDKNPIHAAGIWKRKLKILEDKNNVMSVSYERLLENVNLTMDNIFNFLDNQRTFKKTKFQEEYFNQINSNELHLHKNVQTNPSTIHINKWKHKLSKNEIFAYEQSAGDTLVKYGYELESHNKLFINLVYTMYFTLSNTFNRIILFFKYITNGRIKSKILQRFTK